MKVLYLEDHVFFASEIVEYLQEEKECEVFYATSYKEAQQYVHQHGPFDVSLLDVLLQNGKTGFLFAEEYSEFLGRVMFITGCVDRGTLERIKSYPAASKLFKLWDKIDEFLDGGCPTIETTTREVIPEQ